MGKSTTRVISRKEVYYRIDKIVGDILRYETIMQPCAVEYVNLDKVVSGLRELSHDILWGVPNYGLEEESKER